MALLRRDETIQSLPGEVLKLHEKQCNMQGEVNAAEAKSRELEIENRLVREEVLGLESKIRKQAFELETTERHESVSRLESYAERQEKPLTASQQETIYKT